MSDSTTAYCAECGCVMVGFAWMRIDGSLVCIDCVYERQRAADARKDNTASAGKGAYGDGR